VVGVSKPGYYGTPTNLHMDATGRLHRLTHRAVAALGTGRNRRGRIRNGTGRRNPARRPRHHADPDLTF